MKKVKIEIKDAYGIGFLSHEFDFDYNTGNGHNTAEHSQTNIVYARNGTMKTSFTKALNDYSKNKPTIDPVHSRVADIKVTADGTLINRDSIFVVKSEEEYFETEGMSLLLADKASQERYAEIMADLDAAQAELFEPTGRALGIRGGDNKVTERFDADFAITTNNRLTLLLSMRSEVENAREEYKSIDYKMLTETKITDFLDKPATQVMLQKYAETYEKILRNSEYFQENAFDYLNAFSVQRNLEENNFMEPEVGNWVTLKKKDGSTEEVKSINDLRAKYESDKNRIFETLEQQEEYRKFDDALGKNSDLRKLQLWVRQHKELVPYLQNYKSARKQLWYIHFQDHQESYDNYIAIYEARKTELNNLISRSRGLMTEWKKVVDDFKLSFAPPFDMEVKNKEDVILQQQRPIIVLKYQDDRGGSTRELDADVLYRQVLSKGERRALYILCVMFELHMRKLSNKESLIIFDDIADSFDYRNKYAIIEYLHEISLESANKIYMILLTHNYDFFRAFRMRCSIQFHTSPKALEAQRKQGTITIRANVHTDEFKRIKTASKNSLGAMLTLIPLARNIIEYGNGGNDFMKLTSVLHVKSNSPSFTMNDICGIIESHITGVDLASHKSHDIAQQKILDEAASIAANPNDKMEDKVILSMATRILAETYIKDYFTSDNKTLDETASQTGQWSKRFMQEYPNEIETIKALRSVNIVTPELLHINAFMYEPIIDMSTDELVKTYQAIKAL
jgi:hypothetical protein